MKALIEAIEKGIEDDYISKSEKKELRTLVEEAVNSKHEANVLRSIIFDKASTLSSSSNHRAVIGWLETLNKVIINSTPEEKEKIIERCYFTPGDDCLEAINGKITGSRNTIECCVFTISDNRISEELVKAHKRGVKVKIITDNDKRFDKGSDIEYLVKSGIDVKMDNTENHMHHKFAIFDKKWTLTGSYNWTRSAERYNHENILITNSLEVTKRFGKVFDDLWEKMTWV